MEIFGRYSETVFRNETNGFTVFKFKLNDFIPEFDNLIVKCRGVIYQNYLCIPVKLTGEIKKDKYGETFEMSDVEPYTQSEQDAIDFLSSSCFKGISVKMAEKIVNTIGENVFALADNPDAYSILHSIDGIGPAKAKVVVENLKSSKKQKEVLEYIESFGGTFAAAEKLILKYHSDALNILKQYPYKVGSSCGLSFLSCDTIAKENGMTEFSSERLYALIMNVIEKDYNSKGNSYITLDRLYKNANYLSKKRSAFNNSTISVFQIACICNALPSIITEVVDDEIRYYYNKSFKDEQDIAKNIRRIQLNKKENTVNISAIIRNCEKDLHITYSDKQKECFNFLSSNGLKIITGGPGTGKSTVINGLTYAYHKLYPKNKIVMMAPTGRAAQRIAEITGHEAGTIHRMLGVSPYKTEDVTASYYADYPADMVIVDESSMIDNELMNVLASCIKNNSLLIMVGDIDQLPSIGAGTVLKDIISAGIETVKLDVNYRQKGKSIIIDNAYTVNSGNSELKTDSNFIYNNYSSDDDIKKSAIKTFLSLYKKDNPYSVQILCPQLKGKAGINNINKEIQKQLIKGSSVIANSQYTFKIGDKVMAIQNNYDHNYSNGDIGILTDVNEINFIVNINKQAFVIPREKIEDFQLAYACTIHKSQGSEYEAVIICLPKEAQNMIKRNLLYTAITRAKKTVFLYTQKNCVDSAVKQTTNNRVSGLEEKLTRQLKCA